MTPPLDLRTLLRNRPTLDQYTILALADRLFADRVPDGRGRYFGGTLTDTDVAALTAGLRD